MKVDDAIAKLLKAKKRLEPEQGRIARRNARTATLAALTAVRKALDEEFPAIRKERRVTVAMSQEAVARRRKRRVATEFLKVSAADAAALQGAGVKATLPAGCDPATGWLVPKWAGIAYRRGVGTKQIKKAIRSPKERKKIEAYIRLGGGS